MSSGLYAIYWGFDLWNKEQQQHKSEFTKFEYVKQWTNKTINKKKLFALQSSAVLLYTYTYVHI